MAGVGLRQLGSRLIDVGVDVFAATTQFKRKETTRPANTQAVSYTHLRAPET